jgi:cohesin loading factor subunit SCC2
MVESKKRKTSVTAVVEPEDVEEPKKKVRKVERMLVPVLQKLGCGPGGNNVLDNSTYHRFLKTMDIVLESIDYADKSEIEMDDDGNVPSELLLSKSQLNELCSEAAKLKGLGAMEAMPTEKIVRLLTLLEINIRDGCKVTPLADPVRLTHYLYFHQCQ